MINNGSQRLRAKSASHALALINDSYLQEEEVWMADLIILRFYYNQKALESSDDAPRHAVEKNPIIKITDMIPHGRYNVRPDKNRRTDPNLTDIRTLKFHATYTLTEDVHQESI